MNPQAVLALVVQGLALLPQLISTGIDVYSRIKQISDIAKAGADGTLTDEQVAAYRAQLDADLADFNTPIPD